jgi:hypothetical protein
MSTDIVKLYWEKWNKILFSTQPIDRKKSEKAVKEAYQFNRIESPEIYFFESPLASESLFISKYSLYEEVHVIKSCLKGRLRFSLPIDRYFESDKIFETLCKIIYQDTLYSICKNNPIFLDLLECEFLATDFWLYDLRMSEAKDKYQGKILQYDLMVWNILRELCEECPFILTFSDICIIIDRPCELYLNWQSLPHAEGKAAIKFRDGYEIYCNHGTIIPAEYGKIDPASWQPEWILAEQTSKDDGLVDDRLLNALIVNIGYQKFSEELPIDRHRYWENYAILILQAFDPILDWQFFYYNAIYNNLETDPTTLILTFQQRIDRLPSEFTQELRQLYLCYEGDFQLAPQLYSYTLKQIMENLSSSNLSDTIPLFYGDRQEIYYVLRDSIESTISPVYCQFPDREPIVYAECVTSLIVTISQCYQEGAYYIEIDEEKGKKTIEQDLNKIEPIFEKFNPDQIDNWRNMA